MKKDIMLSISRVVWLFSIFMLLGSGGSMADRNFKNISNIEIILDVVIICNTYLSYKTTSKQLKKEDKLYSYLSLMNEYAKLGDYDKINKLYENIIIEKTYEE